MFSHMLLEQHANDTAKTLWLRAGCHRGDYQAHVWHSFGRNLPDAAVVRKWSRLLLREGQGLCEEGDTFAAHAATHPTTALPGSEEKILVMVWRAEQAVGLFHDGDGGSKSAGEVRAPDRSVVRHQRGRAA
jgi:hypothetical protein